MFSVLTKRGGRRESDFEALVKEKPKKLLTASRNDSLDDWMSLKNISCRSRASLAIFTPRSDCHWVVEQGEHDLPVVVAETFDLLIGHENDDNEEETDDEGTASICCPMIEVDANEWWGGSGGVGTRVTACDILIMIPVLSVFAVSISDSGDR